MKLFTRFYSVLILVFSTGLLTSAQAIESNHINLSELNTDFVIQGWGEPGQDCSVEKRATLLIGGQKFERGLGTHSEGYINIDLKGTAERFHSWVGIDDEVGDKGSCEFIVKGDEKILYKSGILKGSDKAKEIDIKLEKIKILTLETTDGGDGIEYDHADWADCWIEYTGQKPEAVRFKDKLYEYCGWEGKSDAELAQPVKLPFTKSFPSPITDYMVLTFNSPWGGEYEIKTQQLSEEGFSFIQKSGRSCKDKKPFIILFNTKTKRGIAVMLAWSGNWAIEVKADGDKVKLVARTSPADLPKITEINSLPIPGALVCEFAGHWDYGTLPIRRFIRQKLLRDPGDNWPVVQYNDYYGTFGNFDEKLLIEAAKSAAEIGCELFTIDAGWYGNKERWEEAVGDWNVNPKKFPNGIEPVAEAVRGLGMKFGMWVEIECANPKSDTAQNHPDWVMVPTAWGTQRLILNFGNEKILAYAKSVIDNMMKRYKLDYIKMDFNADPATDSENRSGADDPLYGHYKGLIGLWEYMHKNYSGLVIENCSSGSLRQDVMTAALTDTHWTSDNVDNHCNLAINYGATCLFPPEICSDWTTYPEEAANRNKLDIPSRFNVNMMGHLGLSGKIWEWTNETKKIAAEKIAIYKKIRGLIRDADVYHLTPQPIFNNPSSITAVQYADTKTDRDIVFVFQTNDPLLTAKLRLRALKDDKEYRILLPKELGGKELKIKGKELMEDGLEINFTDKGVSGIIQIR